jgi:hypothetical protein
VATCQPARSLRRAAVSARRTAAPWIAGVAATATVAAAAAAWVWWPDAAPAPAPVPGPVAQPEPPSPPDRGPATAAPVALSPLAQVRADLAAGRLGAAAAQIAALGDDRGAVRLRQDVDDAVAAAVTTWEQRIAAATDPSALTAEITAADLPEAARTTLLSRLTTPAADDRAQAWADVAAVLDRLRGGDGFAEVGPAIAAADLGPDGAGLAELPRLLQQAEAAVRVALRGGVDTDAVVDGRRLAVRVVSATTTTLTWRTPEGRDGQSPRAGFARGAWRAIVSAALADVGGDHPDAALAAYLWYWREPGTVAALAGAGDHPAIAPLRRLDRLQRPLPVEASQTRSGDAFGVTYDLAADARMFPDDFLGDGRTATETGLAWASTAVRGDRDDPAAGMRWAGAVRAPARFSVRVQAAPESLIALGPMAGDQAVRAAIALRTEPPSAYPFGVILPTPDGRGRAAPAALATHPAGRVVELVWSVAADGAVRITADQQPIDVPDMRLPTGQPITFVVHSPQRSGRSGCLLTAFTAQGLPP